MEMLTFNKHNVQCNDTVVKIEPKLSEDTFDYDLPCTQTLPQCAFNEIKIEYDDGAEHRNKCNVASHIINIKVERNPVEEMDDHIAMHRQTLAQFNAIGEIKIEYNNESDQCNVKLESKPITDHCKTDEIMVEVIQDIINHKDLNNTTNIASNSDKMDNHEEIYWNDASESITIAGVKHEDVFSGEDYSSDDDLPLAETVQKAELNYIGEQQIKCLTADLKLMKDNPQGEFPADGRLMDNDQLTCQMCPYQTNDKSKMLRHSKTHAVCKASAVKHNLKGLTHSEEMSIQCHICHKIFTRKNSLTVHITKTHSGDKPYPCDVCQKTFTEKTKLKIHMRTHSGEKPFPCEVCHKLFSDKSNFARHMRTHSQVKPFSCKLCDRLFTEKGYLRKHMRTHSGEKPFSCKVCDKTFTEKGYLTKHMRTHSGEDTFSCEICHKTLMRKDNLAKHMRTHSGEKPFACEVCHKTFTLKGTLIRHMRIHTGE